MVQAPYLILGPGCKSGQIGDAELFLNGKHLVHITLKSFVAEHSVFILLHPDGHQLEFADAGV